jgi:telomerase protein component 1
MADKFPEFDVYQLGKYNKEKSIKKKAKKLRLKQEKEGITPNSEGKPAITMKQMIRQLHISSPTYNTMCILGKKYPSTDEEFQNSNLPGQFEPGRAGKRMKLSQPETWETFLSLKGNKASTWEELIEHQKLPFMAMLRNLRNLIFTGVHPKYHRWVINKLKNERAVASSRQFPTRFFSAYEVIPRDLEDFKAKLNSQNNPETTKDANGKDVAKRARKNILTPAIMPQANLFQEYREALDTAVKIATVHNIKPIYGTTLVLCSASQEMRSGCNTAKGMGAIKKLNEVGALMGLMCKHACEDAEFL